MKLNLKNRTEIIKTENQRNRSMNRQKTEKRKPGFTKEIGRKCRLI